MLASAAAGALAAGGIYELVDQFAGEAPKRATPLLDRPDEQHLLDSVSVVLDNNVEVVVPPRHHQLVTASVRADDVRAAQRDLSGALDELERRYDQTPAGLGVTLAWGLPYFERRVPEAWRVHAPQDRRARKGALLAAARFPSDPPLRRACCSTISRCLTSRASAAASSAAGCRRSCPWPLAFPAPTWSPNRPSSSSASRQHRRTRSARA